MTTTDPSDGMNDFMASHLTMWGAHISAQMREHPTMHFPPADSDLPPRLMPGLTQTVMALYINDQAQYSPEDGNPVLIGASDLERLRDLLWCAEQRGMIPPMEVVNEAGPSLADTSPDLLAALAVLGDEYGPLGVARAARKLVEMP